MMQEIPYVHQEVVPFSSDLSSFFFKDLVPEENPILLAIGGGPCSGKTTWRRKMQAGLYQEGLKNYFLHDMDEVMVQLPGYKEDFCILGGKAAFEKWWPHARELSEEWVRLAIKSHYSILYDRTCGAESSYQDLFHAKKQGYYIRLIGLTVERSTGIARAMAREKEEGRVITEEIIDEYRCRFSALWPKYLTFVDEASLYDTTSEPPKLIFSSKDGVIDPTLYENFLAEGAKRGYNLFF